MRPTGWHRRDQGRSEADGIFDHGKGLSETVNAEGDLTYLQEQIEAARALAYAAQQERDHVFKLNSADSHDSGASISIGDSKSAGTTTAVVPMPPAPTSSTATSISPVPVVMMKADAAPSEMDAVSAKAEKQRKRLRAWRELAAQKKLAAQTPAQSIADTPPPSLGIRMSLPQQDQPRKRRKRQWDLAPGLADVFEVGSA